MLARPAADRAGARSTFKYHTEILWT